MHLDVLDLRSFYYRTRLGRAAQKAVRDQVVALWPPRAGDTVVGFGFAVPLLRPYLEVSERVIGLMPAQQGVMPWPAGMANVSVLCDETTWPIPNDSVQRLVLMHGFETSDNPSALLDECSRVLAPQGRLLVIAPNRAGLWSRSDGTPFGFGRPYSAAQLEAQLKRHGFLPERTLSALYAPPNDGRFWLRTADAMETWGRRLTPWRAGGVVMVEATRQIWAPRRGGLGAVVRAPLKVLEGATRPVAEPGRARTSHLTTGHCPELGR